MTGFRTGLTRAGTALPGIGGAVLAKLACPACWPLFAGVLGSVGLSATAFAPLAVPLAVGFLLLALITLALGARRRGGYGPLWLGAAGAGAILAGELALSSEFTAFTGVALLIGASLWNVWPRRARASPDSCGTCGIDSRDLQRIPSTTRTRTAGGDPWR